MTYEIQLSPRAESDVAAAYDWIALIQGRPQEALRWLTAFLEALDSLRSFPLRCPLGSRGSPVCS